MFLFQDILEYFAGFIFSLLLNIGVWAVAIIFCFVLTALRGNSHTTVYLLEGH